MSFVYDLHIHSNKSDGTDSPRDIVCLAKENGVNCVALTDHDTIAGLEEWDEAGKEFNLSVVGGVELDIESAFEMHILGIGIQRENEALNESLLDLQKRRKNRNALIKSKLFKAGIDIEKHMDKDVLIETRLHIAYALVRGGYAINTQDAFKKYLNKGAVGYCFGIRYEAHQAISIIKEAGGFAVLAHPCFIKADIHKLLLELKHIGLDAIEAYYPSCSNGQRDLYLSLAREHKLLVTAGSDYHGKNRPGVTIGMTWENNEVLKKTESFIKNNFLDAK